VNLAAIDRQGASEIYSNEPMLIIIPARGGSKGLPGKNIKLLDGLPLIAWTFEAVKIAGLSNVRCILSTDDEAIAAVGRQIGMDVPFIRPARLGADTTSAVDVAIHALDWMCATQQCQPTLCMLLQPTSPFRSPRILRDAMNRLAQSSTDAVIGVKPIYRSLHTLFHRTVDNMLMPLADNREPINHKQMMTRRQDVEPCLTPNGAMYLVKTVALYREKVFFTQRCCGLEMDAISSHDIDTPIDWDIAQAFVTSGLTWRDSEK